MSWNRKHVLKRVLNLQLPTAHVVFVGDVTTEIVIVMGFFSESGALSSEYRPWPSYPLPPAPVKDYLFSTYGTYDILIISAHVYNIRNFYVLPYLPVKCLTQSLIGMWLKFQKNGTEKYYE